MTSPSVREGATTRPRSRSFKKEEGPSGPHLRLDAVGRGIHELLQVLIEIFKDEVQFVLAVHHVLQAAQEGTVSY